MRISGRSAAWPIRRSDGPTRRSTSRSTNNARESSRPTLNPRLAAAVNQTPSAYHPSMDAPVTTPIRVGIAGAGFAAASHLDALRRLENVQIAGLLASSPERTRAAAERLGVPPAGPPGHLPDADAAHTCTPPDPPPSLP